MIDNEEARKRNEERNRKIREEKAAKGELEETTGGDDDEGGMWGRGSNIQNAKDELHKHETRDNERRQQREQENAPETGFTRGDHMRRDAKDAANEKPRESGESSGMGGMSR